MSGRNRGVHLTCLLCLAAAIVSGQTMESNSEISRLMQSAQQALKAGRPDLARQQYQGILNIDPDNVDAHASLGLLAFFGQNFEGAAEHFGEVVRLQSASWDAHAFLGMALRRIGDAETSQRELDAAFSNLPEQAELKVQIGMELVDMHYQAGEFEQAAAVIDEVRRLQPDSMDVLYAAYHIHSKLADMALDAMTAVGPESARMFQIIAQRRAESGDVQGAIEYFRKAIELNPQLPGVRFEYAQTLLQDTSSLESLDAARDQFQQVLSENPANAPAERLLGEALLLLGEDDAAKKHFERALRLNPEDAEAHFGLGKLLVGGEDPAIAAKHLEEAIRLNPQHVLAHYRLANAYQRLGRSAEADETSSRFEALRAAERADDALNRLLERQGAAQQP